MVEILYLTQDIGIQNGKHNNSVKWREKINLKMSSNKKHLMSKDKM